jgi:hypothetical protein
MGNLRKLKRNLDPYKLALAKAIGKRRADRDPDHFKNRRSTHRPNKIANPDPMPEPSILPLVKGE